MWQAYNILKGQAMDIVLVVLAGVFFIRNVKKYQECNEQLKEIERNRK